MILHDGAQDGLVSNASAKNYYLGLALVQMKFNEYNFDIYIDTLLTVHHC